MCLYFFVRFGRNSANSFMCNMSENVRITENIHAQGVVCDVHVVRWKIDITMKMNKWCCLIEPVRNGGRKNEKINKSEAHDSKKVSYGPTKNSMKIHKNYFGNK